MVGTMTNGGRVVVGEAVMGGDIVVPAAGAGIEAFVSMVKFLRLL